MTNEKITNDRMDQTAGDLVSIIVPCYNNSRYLRSTISNILSQNYKNIECIIVDDGSTDNTEEIGKQLETSDSRVRYLKKNHAGVAAARNYGINHAKGGWIQQLDADDILHVDKIRSHMAQLSDLDLTKNIIFYTDWDIIWENKDNTRKQGESIIVGKKTKAQLLKELVKWNFQPNSPLSNNTIFCKKSVFDLKMYDETLGAFEDFDLFTSLLLADTEFVYTPIIGMSYLQHTSNMTSDKSKMIINYIRYLETLNEKDPHLLKDCQSIGSLLCETLINKEKKIYNQIINFIKKTNVPVKLCNIIDVGNTKTLKAIYLIRSLLPILTVNKIYREIIRIPKRIRWHLKHRLRINI